MEFKNFIKQFKKELKKKGFKEGIFQDEVNEDDTYLWISDAQDIIGNEAENYHYEIIAPDTDDEIEEYTIGKIKSNCLNHKKNKIYLELHAEFDFEEDEAYLFYLEKVLPMFDQKAKGSEYELFSWKSEINKPIICIRCKDIFEIKLESINLILKKLADFDKIVGNELRKIVQEIINLSGLELDDLEKLAKNHEQKKPKRIIASGGQYYRSPVISEYIKRKAKGICQLCNNFGPKDNKDNPYLECHHIKWLSRGGADSLDNTVALCPNCHREIHLKNIQSRTKFEKLKKSKMQAKKI